MCQSATIRYVHIMEHPDRAGCPLAVGCVCAGHMEGDYSRARARERRVRDLPERRDRWASSGWKTSRKGNHYRRRLGVYVTVFPCDGGFKVCVDREYFGPFATAREAKLRSFDIIDRAADLGTVERVSY
jgi:hypothetical protein